jgi:CheY-like chemotaxis protein
VKISTEMTDEGDGGEVVSGGVVSGGVKALTSPLTHPPARRRILIVDDQKMNLMVLKAMLKKLGDFDVVTAMNGREALDALESPDAKAFDIVLTDMWMPEMDGEGLVKAIRAREKLKSLPVYVVTADVEMQKRFRDVGFTGILLKPVTVATIGPVLADTAERRS